jgi:hypothetical protein
MTGQPTLEEWKLLRDAAFDDLRKYPIPPNFIVAVQHFRGHAAVSWVTEDGRPANPDDKGVIPIVEPPEKRGREAMLEFLNDAQRKFDSLFTISAPKTADEGLAACLRERLKMLRGAGSSPARQRQMLPRSVIATIAVDMLESCNLFDRTSGTQLTNLLRELLEVDRPKLRASRQFVARYDATWVIAQVENISTRELAKMIGVNATSVSRWRKDPKFQKEVEEHRRFIEHAKEQGTWPPTDHSPADAGSTGKS